MIPQRCKAHDRYDDCEDAFVAEPKTGKLQWTRELAWAAATDAGNAHAKAHGRVAWDDTDYNQACATFYRLWPN